MSRYIIDLRLLVLVALCLISIPACEYFEEEDKNPPPKPDKSEGAFFINAADPRFAEIITDDGEKITFFGTRNLDGSPEKLTGYRIQALNELDQEKADVVTFDSEGRYSNIILKTGEALHLDYLPNDSIALTFSGPDGVSEIITVKGAMKEDNGDPDLGSGRKAADVAGTDGNINIKVTARSKITQLERNVKGGETTVIVRITAGANRDYWLMAPYNEEKGAYSLNIAGLGLVGEPEAPSSTFEDANAVKNTIIDAIEKACSKIQTPGGEVSIPLLIVGAVCPLAPFNPVAAAICTGAVGVTFGCELPKIAQLGKELDEIIATIDSYNDLKLPTDAAVTIESRHSKYGIEYAKQLSISQIRSNTGSPDAEIIHEYTPILKLIKVSGDNQSGEPNKVLANPLVVKILDIENKPVEKVEVQWSAASGSGSVSSATSTTNATGEASTNWTIGDKEEGQAVLAKAFYTPDREITGSPIEFRAKSTTTIEDSTVYYMLSGSWSQKSYGGESLPVKVYSSGYHGGILENDLEKVRACNYSNGNPTRDHYFVSRTINIGQPKFSYDASGKVTFAEYDIDQTASSNIKLYCAYSDTKENWGEVTESTLPYVPKLGPPVKLRMHASNGKGTVVIVGSKEIGTLDVEKHELILNIGRIENVFN